ncbi:MAG TPA: DUF3990 domain-containing protein [Candidatus Odoribacter faecigallinarum]|uniref:DUF3990 domain-containing protein n=1 Tax=Candidatus Odoribacter faecigallinarum TaxID=2838706 RepID=A0A9D1UZG1_9BACT|nr:DUF3990 domain-containing protein [Candidatus Odoribacter faecigallinarum]
MTLYHGSNVEIETINLDKCSPYKDFGKGFYLTDIKEQAKQMAVRRTRIAGEGKPTVTAYSFDERLLENSSLQVKLFDTPSKEWALFILANRKGLMQPVYDIVIGPIADDGVVFQLERYMHRLITLDTLVEELTYRKLNRQYFFGTELSISKLQKL